MAETPKSVTIDLRFLPEFREALAIAWDVGWVARDDQSGNFETLVNPYSGLPGDDAHVRLASRDGI